MVSSPNITPRITADKMEIPKTIPQKTPVFNKFDEPAGNTLMFIATTMLLY
jgi:hypothetical protein